MKKKLSDIIIPEGRRDIDPVKVSELAESIKIIGLINPITVTKENVLVAGAHRIEAFRFLGLNEIEAAVLDCDELRTELAEIDENLIRNDLDPISIGELAIRRDEILTALGLRASSGTNVKNSRTGAGTAPVPKTTQDIADEIGISKRTLKENKQLAKNLIPEAKASIREKSIPKTTALEISRLKPEQQREVIAKRDKREIQKAAQQKVKEKEKKDGKRKKTIAKEPTVEDTPYIVVHITHGKPIIVRLPLPPLPTEGPYVGSEGWFDAHHFMKTTDYLDLETETKRKFAAECNSIADDCRRLADALQTWD